MRGQVGPPHALQERQEGHIAEWPLAVTDREDELAAPDILKSFRIAIARGERGTQCSRLALTPSVLVGKKSLRIVSIMK